MTFSRGLIVLGALSLMFNCACERIGLSVSEPTSTPTATATSTPSPAPTLTPVPPTATATPTVTATPAPSPTPCLGSALAVYRGNPNKMMIALTFDVESTPGFIQQILDTLSGRSVRATFAVTGSFAQANPGLVRAIAGAGHQVMNHSQDHSSFTGRSTKRPPLTTEQRIWELQTAGKAIQDVAGVDPSPYFRPPYGDLDNSVLCDLTAAGYAYAIMWNADTKGYRQTTVDEIVQTALAQAKPGGIVVMHVASNSADAAALPRIIDALRANGHSFGTVDEVIH